MHPAEGSLARVHKKDFFQAMGIAPEMKYRQEGGPNLIGSNDSHGKTICFLMRPGRHGGFPTFNEMEPIS